MSHTPQQFSGFAKDILSSAENKARVKFSILENLATTITSHSLSTEGGWPNITLPFFEREARSLLNISGAEFIAFAPLITEEEKAAWEEYSVENQGWLREGLDFLGRDDVVLEPIIDNVYEKTFDDGSGTVAPNGTHVPLWQISPTPVNSELVNKDLYSISFIRDKLEASLAIRRGLLSKVLNLEFLLRFSPIETYQPQARSLLIQPVYKSFDDDAEIGGFVFSVLAWSTYFTGVLPESENGLLVDVKDTCGSAFTYRIDGPIAHPVNFEDEEVIHKDVYTDRTFLPDTHYDNVPGIVDSCDYTMSVFSTEDFRNEYQTNGPVRVTVIVGAAFVLSMLTFFLYDYIVRRRQNSLQNQADRTSAIVDSLFPQNVQDRLLQGEGNRKASMKTFESTNLNDYNLDHNSAPIADLFPETTIMFADLVGFTAWSSAREPAQVFTLLETVYSAFDQIARKRGVFKVETVGDCYVAAVGLPRPRKDHAVVMARFAQDCLAKMSSLVKELEVTLGPDTADLGMRFGIHSGPVTAGVLRGERARFQLFGDTMNTCSRVESTGKINKIHLSEASANLIRGAGKGHWVTERSDKVEAKGKGTMQTFWLQPKSVCLAATASSSDVTSEAQSEDMNRQSSENAREAAVGSAASNETTNGISEKQKRLVTWNVDILSRILRNIVAHRHNTEAENDSRGVLRSLEQAYQTKSEPVFDEIVEIIQLPEYKQLSVSEEMDANSVELDSLVLNQLEEYVMTIAAMYHDNPFHNFEHASHVAMSVVKLLSRIVSPIHTEDNSKEVHDNTYGITSDPLTQFAVVLSALIHDVDHPGVPNAQLVKEGQGIAKVYKNRSIAEQNSVDLAWDLLMDSAFTELRDIIYGNRNEFKRFRNLVVNTVMATDIMDKDLKALRNSRWEKAFDGSHHDDSPRDTINRKATIVIEHLIQASDVAHTMQHWHIYRKWNQRLFEELYLAYVNGRSTTDPTEFWFEGEIGFLDFYVIPLARKLKECGVFGVSSDEYLNYALQNREEWRSRGKEIVAEYVEGIAYNKKEKGLTTARPPKFDGAMNQQKLSANSA